MKVQRKIREFSSNFPGTFLEISENFPALAGNIIPAIATTNAVIAGLIVMESFKILQNQLSKCRTVVLQVIFMTSYSFFMTSHSLVMISYCHRDISHIVCMIFEKNYYNNMNNNSFQKIIQTKVV